MKNGCNHAENAAKIEIHKSEATAKFNYDSKCNIGSTL